MDSNQVIKTLLILSVVILVIPAVVWVIHRFKNPIGASYRKTRVSHMLVFSACLIASVWCLRYAVGYYGILCPEPETKVLSWWEEIFNSFLHTLQTFSMDEEYTEYILKGKDMILYVFGKDAVRAQTAYGVFASFLNFLAPIAGGAIIFDILASIFPKVRLYLSHVLLVWKKKYYFSELNSASLALAKSILNSGFNYFNKPILIFTDTYYDNEEEKGSELFSEAKLLGAICIRDDLSHVKKNRFGKRKFFLIDESEQGNLQTLAEFANSSNSKYMKKSEIYLFTNDDVYVQLEQRVCEKLQQKFKAKKIHVLIRYYYQKLKTPILTVCTKIKNKIEENRKTKKKKPECNADTQLSFRLVGRRVYKFYRKTFIRTKRWFREDRCNERIKKKKEELVSIEEELTQRKLPTIVPVNSYRNLISNLLCNVPLYESIIGREKDADAGQNLNVTILGSGNIGTEMFLSTYWFGQILDCKLNINIISKESEEEFWNRIDYINPEIRHTTIKDDPILIYNRKGDKSEVYCTVKYIPCDVKSSEFINCLKNPEKGILNTDYFLVALGSDEENISVANIIRRYIGEHHINQKKYDKTIIAYVVYNSELADTLNQKKYFKHAKDNVDVYMQAVGCLSEVYSVDNVFMEKYDSFVDAVKNGYDTLQKRKDRAGKHRARRKDDYKHWASLARTMHAKYKMYSMKLIEKSMFDYFDMETKIKDFNGEEEHLKYLQEVYDGFQKNISGKTEVDQELFHRMAWLEHRRWNAFTRVMGFRCTTEYDEYSIPKKVGSYKQMDIKLHPCLVECDEKGIRSGITPEGKVEELTLLQCDDRAEFDLLDDLSYDLCDKNYNNYDFKQYDYLICDKKEEEKKKRRKFKKKREK